MARRIHTFIIHSFLFLLGGIQKQATFFLQRCLNIAGNYYGFYEYRYSGTKCLQRPMISNLHG
jgi:hypothetical protein